MEKYGFAYINVQSECLDRGLAVGKYTLEELSEFFHTYKIKMLFYNALVFFNMKQTEREKDAVMALLDEIIRRCQILDCKIIAVVPSMDLTVHVALNDIRIHVSLLPLLSFFRSVLRERNFVNKSVNQQSRVLRLLVLDRSKLNCYNIQIPLDVACLRWKRSRSLSATVPDKSHKPLKHGRSRDFPGQQNRAQKPL